MWASKLLHLEDRVGYFHRGDAPHVFDGIDTVHVKNAFDLFDLGHGYVAEEDRVLSDMNQAIRHGATPRDRRLAERFHAGRTFWELDVD
ncbi:MAG: hypothetical protein KDB27_05170 [Planctomycetales bacterium]|nr:hypothetical protein [Planctomycetales bacterium]